MFDAEAWAALREGTNCPLCREAERLVVATLPSGRVELVNDADFVGYCILVSRRHVVELYDLSAAERGQFMEDIAFVARTLAAECQPAKFNYEMLGNVVPHLHCHIVPRYPDDGYWGAPLWNRPAEKASRFSEAEYAELAARLRSALTR